MSDRNPVSTNPATPFANAVQIAVTEYMKDKKEPWIAYKILAAVAIDPETGFKHANLAVATLDRGVARARPWYA